MLYYVHPVLELLNNSRRLGVTHAAIQNKHTHTLGG